MNKNETITLIRNAKSGHKKWVENAISLSKGLPLDQSQVPINATECVFGQWYYSDEGQNLKTFAIFKDIEKYHDSLHKNYREIFILLFEKHEEPSWLSRLFGVSRDIAEEKQNAVHEKLQLLEQQSRIIMKKLDDLEALIMVMPSEQSDNQKEQSLS